MRTGSEMAKAQHSKRVITSGALLGLVCLLMAGCSQQKTLGDWQAAVNHYVAEQANGDPNFARGLPSRDGRRMFSVIGEAYPDKSTDVHGVLVGQRVVAGQPWSVFIVGVVNKRQVRDIRVAAVAGPGPAWRVSEPNPAALATYRDAREAPGAAPQGYEGWPAEDDVYRLTVEGTVLSVREQRSGARWSVAVGENAGPDSLGDAQVRQVRQPESQHGR